MWCAADNHNLVTIRTIILYDNHNTGRQFQTISGSSFMGITLASLSCSGTLPVDNDRLKMSANGFEITDTTFCTIKFPMPSYT